MTFMACDIGSGSIRSALAEEDGKLVFFDQAATPVHELPDGTVEIDAASVCTIVLGMIERASRGGERRVRGIGFSCLGTAFVPVGPGGEATSRAISPLDERATVQPPGGPPAVERYRKTGQNPAAMSSMYQLRYLSNRADRPLADATSLLSLRSMVIASLCGERVEDHSWASRTMLYDWSAGDWSDELLAYAGAKREQMPQIVESTRSLPVRPERVRELGLDGGAVAVVGGLDNCCAVAATRADPRTLVNISGTFEHLSAVVPGGGVPAFVTDAGAFAFRSVFPEEAIACSRTTTGRSVAKLIASGVATRDYLERGVPPGPRRSGPELEITRLLDRGCFEMRRFLDAYETAVGPVEAIVVVGGGARSAATVERKANVLGRTLLVAPQSEASLSGALWLTRIAAHGEGPAPPAGPPAGTAARVVEPDPDLHAAFEPHYEEFKTHGS